MAFAPGNPWRFTRDTAAAAGSRTSPAKARAARRNGKLRKKGQWPLVRGRQDWAVPPALFEEFNREFRFTLTPAANHANARPGIRYYTAEDDGLAQPWAPERVWCNPPYDPRVLPRWVEKGRREAERGALVVMLLPARTDNSWWHEHVEGRAEVRFLRGRVKFVLPDGASSSSPFPSALVVFRPLK